MGAIIALTISKPVEIRMFKTEIDITLREKQIEQKSTYIDKVNKTYDVREKQLESDMGTFYNDRKVMLENINKANKELTDQLQGRSGAPAGDGKLSKSLRDQRDLMVVQLKDFDNKNGAAIDTLNVRKERLMKEKQNEINNNETIANGLDGLLERIKIAEEISGFWISLFITLLFMAIELTPVFFKLMLTKTPYDYLAENRDELLKAQYGIEVKYDFYKDKEGQERHLIINHEAERLIYEKIKVTEIQNELTNYAIEQYKIREMKKIDENIDDYIKSMNTNEESNKQA